MYVKDWMTHPVYTIDVEDSVISAIRLMKERQIKHLPVMENGNLIGIVSDRKLKEYTPSKGTALDIYELNYLLENTKIKEIYNKNVITTSPFTPIEDAAAELLEHRIGCLPVIEEKKLVGIISDMDIYKAIVSITGAKKGGYRVTFILDDRPGTIREAADVIRKHGFGIESILSKQSDIAGKRNVVIRSRGNGNGEEMIKDVFLQYPDANIYFNGRYFTKKD